jgi:hypothetical protein
MKRVGIGGFQNFDAALQTPQGVEKRLVFMTPEWKDAFKYASTQVDQLGLEWRLRVGPDGARRAGRGCSPRRR